CTNAREQVETEPAAAEITLNAQPTLDVMQSQQQLWQRRQLQVNEWLRVLTARATFFQNALNRLAEIRKTWRLTRDAAIASTAPAAVLTDIDGAPAAIEAPEGPLTAHRTTVLDPPS